MPCYYLTFDAVPDDYISLAGISLTPPFTLVCWGKRRVTGVSHGVLGRASSTSYFVMGTTDRLASRHGGDTQGLSTASTSTAWVHRAFCVPAGVAAKTYFRNGVDATDVAGAANGATVVYTQLGQWNRANSWDGQLAAIGIAPGVLNIAAMWAAGTFHKPLDPTVFTLACWNMRNEGGAGTTLDDESASGNDGTFKGAGEPAWGGLMSVGGPAGWSDA